jgi:hypothetical protein
MGRNIKLRDPRGRTSGNDNAFLEPYGALVNARSELLIVASDKQIQIDRKKRFP